MKRRSESNPEQRRKTNASNSWDCSQAKAALSGSNNNPLWAVHNFKPPALPRSLTAKPLGDFRAVIRIEDVGEFFALLGIQLFQKREESEWLSAGICARRCHDADDIASLQFAESGFRAVASATQVGRSAGKSSGFPWRCDPLGERHHSWSRSWSRLSAVLQGNKLTR